MYQDQHAGLCTSVQVQTLPPDCNSPDPTFPHLGSDGTKAGIRLIKRLNTPINLGATHYDQCLLRTPFCMNKMHVFDKYSTVYRYEPGIHKLHNEMPHRRGSPSLANPPVMPHLCPGGGRWGLTLIGAYLCPPARLVTSYPINRCNLAYKMGPQKYIQNYHNHSETPT